MIHIACCSNEKLAPMFGVYNVEKYVAECLNSVISQTYDHSKIECIIVNDCTTDDSMDIVYEIIKKYDGGMSFIICRHEHNEGLSAARNTGIEVAKCNYIFFIDSDDYIYPNSLELLLNASKIYGYSDMVVGNFYYEFLKKNNYTFDKVVKLKYIDSMFWGKTLKLTSWNILTKWTVFIETGIRFSVGRYLRRISHSLIYYNFTHIRIFLLMLSVLTLQPISNKIVNSRFFRSNIDRVFKLLLYPALWTNKLHFY